MARIGEGRVVHRVLVGKPEERDHWGDPDVDGRILRWIFRKWVGGCGDWMELAQDRDRWRALRYGEESSGSKTAGNFLTTPEPVSFSRRTLLHGVSK